MVSVFGSLITRMALPFVAILVLGAGPLEVAVLRGLEIGTGLIVGLVAGAWVDRLRRRPILIWTDLGRAVLLATIPIAFVAGVLTLWHVFLVTALAAILTTFFDAADNAYLPTVVERERLVEANSALAASWSASEFAGFGISGFLIPVLTAPIAIVLDAITFVVSAVLLLGIRDEAPPHRPRPGNRSRTEIAVGIRVVLDDPVLRAFALAQMLHHVLWGVFGAIWILFAIDHLALGPAAIGLIAAAGGAASFVGAIVAHRSIGRWGIGPVAIASMGVRRSAMRFSPSRPIAADRRPRLPAGAAARGDGAATVFEITDTSVRQSIVPDRQLGRVASTFFFFGHGRTRGDARCRPAGRGHRPASNARLRPDRRTDRCRRVVALTGSHAAPAPRGPRADPQAAASEALIEAGQAEPFGG